MTWVDKPVSEFGEQFTQDVATAITHEEGDLLYGLVRMAKPKLALETGAGSGRSTRCIAEALRDNNSGYLMSCDTDEFKVAAVNEGLAGLPARVLLKTGIELIRETKPVQFAFIDAGLPENRALELALLLESEKVSGMLVIHDVLNPNDGDYRGLLDYAERCGWRGIVLQSLAGIAVLGRAA